MKLNSLESTEQIFLKNGLELRRWTGTTERGTPVHVFVAAIAIPTEQCEREDISELVEIFRDDSKCEINSNDLGVPRLSKKVVS